jgi:hypothetical protein
MRNVRPKWHDAYDAQMALWRWYRTPAASRWMRGLHSDIDRDGYPSSFRAVLARMFDAEMGRLVECDPIYVADEMCDLVDYARESFEPEPLLEWDLPTPRAFVFYAKPIVIHDRDGNDLAFRAFSYAQDYVAKDGDVDAVLARINDPAATERFGARITVGESQALVDEGLLVPNGIDVTLYAERDPYVAAVAALSDGPKAAADAARMAADCVGVPVVPMHLTPWVYGESIDGNEVDVDGRLTGVGDWWALLQTTLRLMQQKIRPHGYGRPDRAARREGTRLGFPPDTEVVIVRLRTEEQEREPTEGGTANYSHRFIRSGHWRNQWYPSIRDHRRIWINPTVVGDPSLPLLVRPRRVFQWTR